MGEQMLDLAEMPGREELLARVIGSLNSPVQGFVTVSGAILRKLLHAINAIRDSKE